MKLLRHMFPLLMAFGYSEAALLRSAEFDKPLTQPLATGILGTSSASIKDQYEEAPSDDQLSLIMNMAEFSKANASPDSGASAAFPQRRSATPREVMYALTNFSGEIPALYYCGLESSTKSGVPVAVYTKEPEKLQALLESHHELDFLQSVRVEKYSLELAGERGSTLGKWYQGKMEKLKGGRLFRWAAEESDVWRIDLIEEKGGLYFDFDYLVLNPQRLHNMPEGFVEDGMMRFGPHNWFTSWIVSHFPAFWANYDKDGIEKRKYAMTSAVLFGEAYTANEAHAKGWVFPTSEVMNPRDIGRHVHLPFRQVNDLLVACQPDKDNLENIRRWIEGDEAIAFHTWGAIAKRKVCSSSYFVQIMKRVCPKTLAGPALTQGWVRD